MPNCRCTKRSNTFHQLCHGASPPRPLISMLGRKCLCGWSSICFVLPQRRRTSSQHWRLGGGGRDDFKKLFDLFVHLQYEARPEPRAGAPARPPRVSLHPRSGWLQVTPQRGVWGVVARALIVVVIVVVIAHRQPPRPKNRRSRTGGNDDHDKDLATDR